MKESRQLSLVFPYYYGPKIRRCGASLLWFGRLDCVILPWASPAPLKVFEEVAARARERQLPIAELFDLTTNWFNESCVAVTAESIELEQLSDRITRIAGLGPGGQARFREIRESLHSAVEVAFTLLDDMELLRIAGCQNALFSDGFLAGVYDHTKGVARKINNLCRGALLLGATEGKQVLDETDLKRVILDLEGQVG